MCEWDERYRIGEPVIDEQHHRLFQICWRIIEIFQNEDQERNQRAVTEAVKYLKHYTMEHFAQEEAYQQAIGYEGFPEHKQKHEHFKQTVLEWEKKLEESGYAQEDVEQFVEILNEWLAGHIIHADRAIRPGKGIYASKS